MLKPRFALIAACVALVAAACGDAADDTTTTTAPTTTTAGDTTTTTEVSTTTVGDTTTTTEAAPTIPDPPYLTISESVHGTIVTDHEGNSVYLFTPDDQGDSTCTGACEVTWPPLIDEHGAGPGVDPDLIGLVARADGSMQVTYDDWPLYYYVGDVLPGDTNGQGVGGNWWLIAPDGARVE